MRRSSIAVAALYLLSGCGPRPCKYPQSYAATDPADPPAAGEFFAALAIDQRIRVVGSDGLILRGLITYRNGYEPTGVFYDEDISDARTTATLRGLTRGGPTLYAVGDGGVARVSPDTGESWRVSETGVMADLYAVAHGFDFSDTLIAVGDGVILRSTDGATSWTASTLPADDLALRSVAAPSRTGWLAVGRAGVVLRSSDDGETWTAAPGPTSADLLRVRAEPGSPTYLVGEDGLWTGLGESWAAVEVPFAGEVVDATAATLVTRDGLVAHREGPDQHYQPVGFDAPLPPLRAIVDDSERDDTAVVLAEDGQLIFLRFQIVDRYTDLECWDLEGEVYRAAEDVTPRSRRRSSGSRR